VGCRGSHKGDQKPLEVELDGVWEEVSTIAEEWLVQDHRGRRRCFRIVLSSGRRLIIGRDYSTDRWSLEGIWTV